MHLRPLCLTLTLLLLSAPGARADGLSAEDAALLDGLLKDPLFDPPAAAERVVVLDTARSVWGGVEEVEREAWLVPGAAGAKARLVLADGRLLAETADVSTLARVDLVAAVRELVRPRTDKEETAERFEAMGRAAGRGRQTDPELALAAWLHRRGQDDLAGQLLARARRFADQRGGREKPSLADGLRSDLAWEAFAGLVHAYMVRADAEALSHGEHLLARYPAQAEAEYRQAATVVAELRRRREKKTFGVAPSAGPPEGFDARPAAERIAWLLEALEEVDARQFGQPGGVDLGGDWRVEGLIRQGEVAVPALIDAVEKDERLTRSVHFWRDFSRSRTVLSVREAALVAVMSILRVKFFEASSTGDNFTASDPERARATAKRLREYWEKNGALRPEQRMLRALTDPASTSEQRQEAAQNLAEHGGTRRLGTMVFTSSAEPAPPGTRNPALDLKEPTAAEAILAAYDLELATPDPRWKGDARMELYTRRKVETHYLECLIALQDPRLLPVARERVKTDVLRLRRQWALLCHALGDPAPMAAFRAELEAGSLTLPPIVERQGHDPTEEPGAVELTETVRTLLRVDGGATLHALAAPGHPWRAPLARLVRSQQSHGFDGSGLTAHPFHLQLLLGDLDDTTSVGKVTLRDGELREESDGGSSMSNVPPGYFGDAEVVAEATLRRCDRTAARLAEALLGLPRYHPLMKDRDARLAALKAAAPRLVRAARAATRPELQALELEPSPWSPTFVPDLAALGSRVATAADVEGGRAVFHLPAGARSLGLRLPASARLKLAGGGLQPVLVVQAEVTAAGEERYGVLGVDRVEAVGADRLEGIAPFPDPEEQRAAARLFLARAAAGDEAGVLELLGPEAQAQLEQMGGLKRLLDQLREARAQAPEEQLLEALAPGFRKESDGKWRFASFR